MPTGIPKNGINKGWFKKGIYEGYGFKKGDVPWIKGKRGVIKPNSGSFKKGNIPWHKNTKGIKKPNSTSFKKGMIISKKIRKKMSKYHKGKKLSRETVKKIIKGRKWYKPSEETKRKLSEVFRGEKNPNWKGGISFEPYSVDWTETLKRAIRERDNYICQLCSQYGNVVHHIDYDKKNCNPDNLITLCRKCHTKTNNNRNYWINFLTKL